jgi:hypothetical protein
MAPHDYSLMTVNIPCDLDPLPKTSTSSGCTMASSELEMGLPTNPFDLSTMSRLLNDPNIKELAEQITMDPSFNQMVEQLQQSVQHAGQDGIPQLDTQQYFSTMQQVM